MGDRSFPQRGDDPPRVIFPVEQVLRRPPLAALREVLSLSLHDAINDPRRRRTLAEFYRVSRRIEDEGWLRRALGER
jgi:hypothetical protein